MIIVVLAIIATIILLIIYINQPRSERGFRRKFNNFIDDELRENYCFEKAQEVDLKEPIKLNSRTQLVIFGVNHGQIIYSPWALYLVTKDNNPKRIYPKYKKHFWTQRFTNSLSKDTIKISEPFEIQEIIWSEKEIIPMKGYIVPYVKPKRII